MYLIWQIHYSVCAVLVGLIWMTQWVHYALFELVGKEPWLVYHKAHSKRISYLVLPLMTIEFMATCILVFAPFERFNTLEGFALGSFTLIVWLSTFFLQVPIHRRLGSQVYDYREECRRLVRSNWLRTGAWTAKFCLCFAIDYRI